MIRYPVACNDHEPVKEIRTRFCIPKTKHRHPILVAQFRITHDFQRLYGR